MRVAGVFKIALQALGLCVLGGCLVTCYMLSPKEKFKSSIVSPDKHWRCRVVQKEATRFGGNCTTTITLASYTNRKWMTVETQDIPMDSIYPTNPDVTWVSNRVVVTAQNQVLYERPLQ